MKWHAFAITFFVSNLVLGAEIPQTNGGLGTADGQGIVYYLDGAGGGSLFTNWAPGVRHGLRKGGFTGQFQEFVWHTGLGVLADQTASVEYKRTKARILAGKIVAYKQAHPDRPVTLIGLSAGTAVTIFTVEALPPGCTVDMVILLGSSVDARYNLTAALGHISENLLVFTSDRDEVLTMLVPMAGSADRRYVGTDVAGLQGFVLPWRADDQTRQLYRKVKRVPWREQFAQADDHGGHTDTTNPRFVQRYLCPMILAAGLRTRQVQTVPAGPTLVEATNQEPAAEPATDVQDINDLTPWPSGLADASL